MRFHPANEPREEALSPKIDASFAESSAKVAGAQLLIGENPAAQWTESICDMGTRTSSIFPALVGTEKAWCLVHEWKLSGPHSHQVPEKESSFMSFDEGLTYLARRGLIGPFVGDPVARASYREKTELGRTSGSGEYFMAETQELLAGNEPIAEHVEQRGESGASRHTLTPAQLCSYQGWIHSREDIGPDRKHGPEESFVMMEQGIYLLSKWGALESLFRPS